MSVIAADLHKPEGVIDAAIFYPSLDGTAVAAALTAYLAAGYTIASDAGVSAGSLADDIATSYAYYRATDDVVLRLINTPTSVSIGGELSASFSPGQLQEWINMRDRWKAQYLELVPVTASTSQGQRTQSAPIVTRW